MASFRFPIIFCAMLFLLILICHPEIAEAACRKREAFGHGCPSVDSSGCDKWCRGIGNRYGGCSWGTCVCGC